MVFTVNKVFLFFIINITSFFRQLAISVITYLDVLSLLALLRCHDYKRMCEDN